MERKLLILLVFVANNLFAQNLTSNNLIIVRVGDGSSALGTTSAAVFFDEYKADGTLVQSVPLPTSVQGSNKRLTLSGDKSDEGYISLSPDGEKIALFGYDCDPGVTAPSTATSASVNRVIGVLTVDKSVNTTKFLSSMFSTVVARSAAVSGDNLWVTGGNTGIVHTTYNGTGTSTANTILATTSGRVLSIYDGQLYVSSLGAGVRMGKVGTGLAVTTGQTITSLPGYPVGASDAPFQYVFSDQNASIPGVDVLYVSDALRGLLKYSFDGTNWVYNGVITGGSYMGLTGKKVGNSMQLYGTRRIGSGSYQFQFFTLTDDGGHNASFSNTVVTVVATAGTNTVFRGIAFAPNGTKTWTGATSTDFNTGSNWSDSVTPTSTDVINIPTGVVNYPVISANTTINEGTIAAGASLTIDEGKVLTITSSMTNNGDLILKSSASGTASLLSSSSVANVTQQRYLSSNQRGWRLLSNPLTTTTYGAVATNSTTPLTLGNGTAKTYDSATNTWAVTNTDDAQTWLTKTAVSLFVRGVTSEVTGTSYSVTPPSNVTLAIKGAATNAAPAQVVTTAGQYYLVANPYTAPVSVYSILGASIGLSTTVSYYNPTIGSGGSNTDLIAKFGGYANPTITAATQGDANDVVLPPMGAIFVQATSSGTIDIPKTAIFTGSVLGGSYNHKTAQTKVASANVLKVEVNSDGTYYDALALQFKAIGESGSNVDFGKLPNTVLDVYSLAGSQKMAVSELELKEQTIPLGITSTIQKNYTFKVAENTIPAGYEAVLIDNVLNTSTVLTSGTNYSFGIDSTPASQGNARFAINLKMAGTLSLVEKEFDSKIYLWPNPANGQFTITNDLNQKDGVSTIEISSVNGQVIHSQKSNPGAATIIQTNGWAAGVYILKATNNGTQTTKKIIIQ